MNHTIPISPPPAGIADRGRAERARRVANALATIRMEGAEPHAEVLALSERYVNGELTLQDLGCRVEALFSRPSVRV